MSKTLNYYNENWKRFKDRVHGRGLSEFYEMFFRHVQGKRVLDLGCGTGRDAARFAGSGFEVVAVDGSSKMVELTKNECASFENIECYELDFRVPFKFEKKFSGVWAMASLLHVEKALIPTVLGCISKALEDGGALFATLKKSASKVNEDGRMFEYWSLEEFVKVLKENGFDAVEQSENSQNEVEWITVVAKKA